MEELYHCLNGLKVDLLILNAGITAPSAIACSTDQQIDEIFQVNMIQQIRLLRHLVPLMNRRSRILQISSKSTLVALPFMGFYAASKAAFLSVMEALRLELQPQDIAVSSIILGNVSTDMWHKTIETFPSIIKHNSMYHGQITRAFDMARVKVREAMDVNDCAAKIIRIAIGRRIKPVYFIGADTLTFRLLRCIPYYVKEYLLKKQYGF
jgi:short-subunit dehydrogenase